MKDKELRSTVSCLKRQISTFSDDTVESFSKLRKSGFLEYPYPYATVSSEYRLSKFDTVNKILNQDVTNLSRKLDLLIDYLGIEIEETQASTKFVKVKKPTS